MNIKEEAYKIAVKTLESCVKDTGFYASGLSGGYEATWSRDSMITSLGASLIDDKFQDAFKNSLILLAKNQSELGQIPNCVGSYNIDRRSDVTFNTLDSSLWFIIGHYVYSRAYKTHGLIEKYKNNIAKALIWLKYQDPNEDKTLSQQPTMDWMDAFPHKYGRTINSHALYYAALNFVGDKKLARYVQRIINGEIQKYLSLFDPELGYYLPWSWKNHDGDREQETWFDSLGNLLAITTGLATPIIAQDIISTIKKKKIDEPYPCKALWPPIEPGDKEWHSYFTKCDARVPFNYLNGGVWPFIGGFYVAALVKLNMMEEAENALDRLAEGNMRKMQIRDYKHQYEFNEWLSGKSGRAKGEPYQGWSAGMYIFAYESVKRRKVPYFG